jgi:hypothetical protein
MLTRALLLGVFLLLAIPETGRADDWILAPGKGSIAPDKSFSDRVTDEMDSRGPDWGPWTALSAVENPDAIPTAGKQFVSPDQKFSVRTDIEDRQFYFVVKNAQTGSLCHISSDLFPVFSIGWSPDSKSFLAIAHASMTSLIEVLHLDGSKWDQFEIDAPEGGDNDKYHVVGWQFKSGYIEAIYIVDHRAENGLSLNLYRCAFHVDPANGEISHVTKAPISQKEFILLRNGSN